MLETGDLGTHDVRAHKWASRRRYEGGESAEDDGDGKLHDWWCDGDLVGDERRLQAGYPLICNECRLVPYNSLIWSNGQWSGSATTSEHLRPLALGAFTTPRTISLRITYCLRTQVASTIPGYFPSTQYRSPAMF